MSSPSPPGSVPEASSTRKEAAKAIERMFARIAPRYDLLNHLLSFGTDFYWRRAAVHDLREILSRPGIRVLDLCCGTGDLTLALKHRAEGEVLGADFCHPMLQRGRDKFRRARLLIPVLEADALKLPFPEETFDLVTLAFGFRNLADYQEGLQEIRRVLRRGGEIAILEFSQIRNPMFRPIFGLYFRSVLPRLGSWISGVSGPYQYLRDSVSRFPDQEQLCRAMRACGFVDARYRNLTGGAVCLHRGTKPT